MDLIGVMHKAEFLDDVDSYLSERYPEGIESLMIELPPLWNDTSQRWDDIFFFEELAERYEREGTRIIYGDLNRSKPPDYVLLMQRKPYDERTTLDYFKFIYYVLSCIIKYSIIDEFILHRRNKGMLKIAKEENPEVVVLGRNHTNYLKKRFRDAYYVIFDSPEDINWLGRILSRKPYMPDEVIHLQDCKKKWL